MTHRSLVPALGVHWLTRFYDPLIALTLRERTLKGRLLDQARLAPGQDVLDVGCGTGTLAILAKSRQQGARVVGLDGDPHILAIARRKVAEARVDVELREGLANSEEVFAPESFDRIVTSFVLHHLTSEEKRLACSAMRRWLRPRGELHALDFGPQSHSLLGLVPRAFARIHGGERMRDNLDGRLPSLLLETGFANAEESGRALTPFGAVSFYRAAA